MFTLYMLKILHYWTSLLTYTKDRNFPVFHLYTLVTNPRSPRGAANPKKTIARWHTETCQMLSMNKECEYPVSYDIES